MKKFSIVAVSLILAGASAFAWSKKSENTGNLGRMYISIAGGIDTSKGEVQMSTGLPQNPDLTSSPTGAAAQAMINAPIFKPGINAFRKIKWAGLDGQIFFNYNYSGDYKFSYVTGGVNPVSGSFSTVSYGIFGGLTPYLNFETGLPVFKAIKPFAQGYAGYMWYDQDSSVESIGSTNYFAYGIGAGVEFVIIDELSFTPMWQWHGNAEKNLDCYQTVGAEVSYWVTDQFCVSAFWTHSFGQTEEFGSSYSVEKKHGDVIGAKFKLGFMR